MRRAQIRKQIEVLEARLAIKKQYQLTQEEIDFCRAWTECSGVEPYGALQKKMKMFLNSVFENY